jgi:hypothetical protein
MGLTTTSTWGTAAVGCLLASLLAALPTLRLRTLRSPSADVRALTTASWFLLEGWARPLRSRATDWIAWGYRVGA